MLTADTHRKEIANISEKHDPVKDDAITVSAVEIDPNLEFAEELRGRTIKITKPMLNMFDEMGWSVLQPDFEKRTEQQKERYLRLRRDTEAILDL